MYKTLIYGGRVYENFVINESGDVINLKTNKLLKKTINKAGYYIVTLPMGKRGFVKSIRVHRAVADTFIPNPNNLPMVDHIDENKLNCNIDNLQWITCKDNIDKHIFIQLEDNEFCNNRKLTHDQVDYIRNNNSLSNNEIADMFGITSTTVSNVRNYKLYT